MIHKIKLSNEFWSDVVNGRKTFELRKNDRNYQVGDYLLMKEVENSFPTSRECLVEVTYKLENYIGLQDGYCILGIRLKRGKI
ncbi:DUF3850 domain-containing protein [Streptococcus sobrinus]|uniref:DUF3850 domain-containing protein n=1 Tax=Streptococcus sobrinus TaxID=1310 RepID=UPI0002EC0E8B|nr:DUF3850 domain-containing protein [Streptococcus sobrinus]